jgi:outer membrane lipoprotein
VIPFWHRIAPSLPPAAAPAPDPLRQHPCKPPGRPAAPPRRERRSARLLRVLTLGLALVLQACPYAVSPDVAARADRTATFDRLTADPAPFTGKTVILGGVIAETKKLRTGTLIEVVQRELDYWGRPLRTDRTGGRFLVLHPAQLDAMIFAPGREITVAGEVMGEEQKVPGAAIPPYLLLRSRELKLWPGRSRTTWDRPEWLDPLYDPSTKPGRYGN